MKARHPQIEGIILLITNYAYYCLLSNYSDISLNSLRFLALVNCRLLVIAKHLLGNYILNCAILISNCFQTILLLE